jgi:type VI secretion system ImpJ/VasE family protein
MATHIHWHEGLFLQPHHLQRMQKSVFDALGAERRLAWAYPYGVIEYRLSRDELEAMRIRFDKLRVIMPSGLEVCFPDNAELPSLDVKQALQKSASSFMIYLGVPLWQEERANAFESRERADSRAKILYRLQEVECADENTGTNPRPVAFRALNARLMMEGEDVADMEVVPLLRVGRAAGEDVGLPRQDPEYVPPCVVLSGSPVLREMVRDLSSQVEASRKELAVQVSRGGFSLETLRGLQFEQLWRLRTLNRFSARLPTLVEHAGSMPPLAMYLELRELLGDLAALHPEQDMFDCPAYDHEKLYPVFSQLCGKIRPFLKGAVGPSYISVPFRDVEGIATAVFDARHFSEPNAYLLGIKTKADPTALARFVTDPDKFKVMPKSLAMSPIFGVELKEERHPPLTLPAQADLHYFRLVTTDTGPRGRWQRIKEEKSAVVRWERADFDLSDAVFTMYMTLPTTATAP